MKYLIGLDIDGTILNDKGEISKETEEYIKILSRRGHIVTLQTGRPFRTSKPIYDQLELNTPIANYSGSSLHHPSNTDFPNYSYKMNHEYLTNTFKHFKDDIINGFCEIEDKVYLYKENEGLIKWLSQNVDELVVGDLSETISEPLSGAVFFINKEIVSEFENFINNNYHDLLGFRIWHSESRKDYTVVELYTPYASKATSLEVVRKYYNIPIEQTIAVGDGGNDIEMIQYANYGVAMGNARDAIKDLANLVTDTNNENGVVNILKKIIGS
ncbi:HAD family phosphatase [Mycoplasmatota bacterium]|nr:HAD family phosphatase [Mycoplasmatota bacterium]